MEDDKLFEGFSPEKQAEHEAWLIDRYGGDMPERIAEAKQRRKAMSEAQVAALMADGQTLEADITRALTDGLPADSGAVAKIMRRWWDWIGASWNREPTPEAFTGLGRLYLEHPEFTARYEALAPGLTEYLAEAMRAYAEKR